MLERKAPPTFDVVVEIRDWDEVLVHEDVAQVVDQWLRGYPVEPEVRRMDGEGNVSRTAASRPSEVGQTPWVGNDVRGRRGRKRSQDGGAEYDRYPPETFRDETGRQRHRGRRLDARIFLFGVSRDKVEAALAEREATAEIVSELRRANLLLTTKNHYRRGSQLVRIAESNNVPVYVLRKNTVPQVSEFLTSIAPRPGHRPGSAAARARGTSGSQRRRHGRRPR